MNHFKPLKIPKNVNLRASCKNQSKSCPKSRQGIHSWHGRHVSGTTSSCGVTLDSLSQVFLPEFQFLLCSRRPFGILQKGPTNPSPFHGTYHELTREFGNIWNTLNTHNFVTTHFFFGEKGTRELWVVGPHSIGQTPFGSAKRHFLKNRKTVAPWTQKKKPPHQPPEKTHEPALQDLSSCFEKPAIQGPNKTFQWNLGKSTQIFLNEICNAQNLHRWMGSNDGRVNCLAADKVSWPQHQLWSECTQWLFTSSRISQLVAVCYTLFRHIKLHSIKASFFSWSICKYFSTISSWTFAGQF